jgi:hypothetical protein
LLEIQEIHPDQLDTHVLLQEQDIASASSIKWFRKQLKKIAGTNRFGEPHLALRWGATYEDPMQSEPGYLKYLDFQIGSKQWGERRWIIEIYRSPEFLKRSRRYERVNVPDTVHEFYFCAACDTEIVCSKETLEYLGAVPPCPKCNSKRVRTEMIREAGGGQVLQEFPVRGCYDYWLRLERANFTYHPLDNEALNVIRALWKWEQMPQNERDAIEQADREIERRQMIQFIRQQTPTRVHFGSGLIHI